MKNLKLLSALFATSIIFHSFPASADPLGPKGPGTKPRKISVARPLIWIESDIDTSYYKGSKPLPKSASKNRGKYAWPIQDKERLNRVVHSATELKPNPRNPDEEFIDGMEATFGIHAAPTVDLTRVGFKWSMSPEGIYAGGREGGSVSDTLNEKYIQVSNWMIYNKTQGLASQMGTTESNLAVNSSDTSLPTPTLKIRWHYQYDPIGGAKFVKFPGTNSTELTRWSTPARVKFSVYSEETNNATTVEKVPMKDAARSVVKVAEYAPPAWLESAYGRVDFFKGPAKDVTRIFVSGSVGSWFSAAASVAGYVVSKDAPTQFVLTDKKPVSLNSNFFAKSMHSDSNPKTAKNPPPGYFVDFDTARMRAKTAQARARIIRDIKANPEANFESFYCTGITISRVYKRRKEIADQWDKHGYVGQSPYYWNMNEGDQFEYWGRFRYAK